MPTANQLRIPPIQDEDLFEDFCRDLWTLIWDDPSAERNGRRGQSQCGVDVFGLPAGADAYEGVQAKAYGREMTDAEIQHEIDEARKFTPALRKLIIACTGPRDAKGQTYVRRVNVDHRRAKLFTVSLLGWEDIKDLVQKHMTAKRPDLLERYFELASTSGEIMGGIAEAVGRAISSQTAELSAVARVDPLPSLIHQEHYHTELNYARCLVNGSRPRQALAYLSACRERFWRDAEPQARYRILHYQGCAQYLLDQTQEAGRALVEALQYNSDDETALTFAALGFLLLDDRERAGTHARRALEKNPGNAKAYATLLQVTPSEEGFGRLVETVPEPYRRLPEVANTLAILARRMGDLPEAERWCRTAIEQDGENWAGAHGLMGEILMIATFGESISSLLLQLTPERRRRLEEAEAEFTYAWERVEGTELERGAASWLSNRGVTRLFLGRAAEAREDFDAALRLDPENPAYIQRRASLAAQEGDMARAVALMQAAPPSPEYPEAPLILAEMLTEEGRHADAERALERIPADAPKATALQAGRIRLRIAAYQKDWPLAEELHANLRVAHSDSVEVMTDGAWLARIAGQEQDASELLAEATRRLTPDSPLPQVHGVAAEWWERGDYGQAAKLYGRLADRDADSPLTRRLLLCLNNAGELGEALRLARHMLALHGPQAPASEIAAAILEGIGDLPGARRTVEDFLARFPDDRHMRLRRAWILHRSGEAEEVEAYLDSPIETVGLPLDESLRVASLYADRGRTERALAVAYETRRKHPTESEAHLFFTGLVFGTEKREHAEVTGEAVVGTDTAVCIRDDDGSEEWHVIEERDDHQAPLELPPSHPLAQKLMGQAPGAKVVIKESEYSTETAVITAVQSKYVYALQETLRTFERMFPETPGMWKMKLPLDPDSAEPDFDPFFRQITRHHEHCLAVERLYREGKSTLGMFARLTGNNVLATWSHAVAKPEVGVRCSLGVAGELEAAKGLARDGTVLVIDSVSLLTLHALEARDALAERFGKFAIAQSTIGMLRRLRQESRGVKSDGYMTVGKEGDRFVRQEITADDIRRNIEYIDGLLAWIDEYCTISPVFAALETGSRHWGQLSELLSPGSVDSILIASEEGKLLYSDDERLRSLAKGEMGRDGVWTQALLARALDDGAIDEETYHSGSVRLSAMNYNVTYLSQRALAWAARKADWSPAYPFSAAARVLAGNQSNAALALAAATETIYQIWQEPLMDHQRSFLLAEILKNLCSGRDRSTMLGELAGMLRTRFFLLPLQFRQIHATIQVWAQTHFL